MSSDMSGDASSENSTFHLPGSGVAGNDFLSRSNHLAELGERPQEMAEREGYSSLGRERCNFKGLDVTALFAM